MTPQPASEPDFVERPFDVAVIGLGPVGATLAALLGQKGLSVIAIEPDPNVYPLPRAAHFDHEIMRTFQALGVANAILPHTRVAPDYEFLTSNGQPMISFQRAGVTGASGWPQAFNFYQPGMELAMRSLLDSLDTVEVHYGSKFNAIVDNAPSGVLFEVVDNSSGAQGQIAARYLVGCDGAWSPVRDCIDGELFDYEFDEPWLVLDVVVPDEARFPAKNLQFCNPERPTSFIHMGPGRLRWEFMLKPGEDPEVMKSAAAIDRLLAPWRKLGELEVERCAVYRFHGLVAEQWRKESVLLAGDAAHQMPPFLGQGLCSGLRDAANLAWKIVAVLRDGANADLLDTYQTERNPHVRYVIEKAIEMGKLVCTIDPGEADRRDRLMLASPSVGKAIAMPPISAGFIMAGTSSVGQIFPQAVSPDRALMLDDVLGPEAWLICRDDRDVAAKSIRGLAIINIDRDIPAILAEQVKAWLSAQSAEGVLVRADRYVFGTGQPSELLAAYARWFPQVHSANGPLHPRSESSDD